MKKFLITFLCILAGLVVVDIIFGYANVYMMRHATGGQTYCQEYITHKSNEDIIMMGSSRMRHHDNPDIISDSLHMSCYNAGEDGGGIILNYGFYRMLSERYHPKIIIYDITEFDIYNGNNEKYLGWLRKYYDEPGIDSIIVSVSSSERIKNISNLYRYNTRCIATAADFFHPVRAYNKGYSRIEGTMNYDVQPLAYHQEEIDPIKLKYLKRLIEETKRDGVLLLLFASPTYDTKPGNNYLNPVAVIAKENKVPFYDCFYCPGISGDKNLFRDRGHMNGKGADIWTTMVADTIKKYLRKDI